MGPEGLEKNPGNESAKMIKKILSLICVAFLTTAITGCGYTTRSALPSSLRTIHVERFDNMVDYTLSNERELYVPLLERDVQTVIVDRYLFDGNLRITEKGNADLILSGALVGFDRSELREADNEDVEEYRIHISVNLSMFDATSDTVMWTEDRFTGEATYFVTGPNATSEAAAIDEALEDLARRIVERTIEDW